MYTQWIEDCVVQRVSLRDGLVLDLDGYSERVISRPLRLTLPPVGDFPAEQVLIDPNRVAVHERPLLDLAGAVCTHARYGDDGALHLGFSRGHRIDVEADAHATAWGWAGDRSGSGLAGNPHSRPRRHRVVFPPIRRERGGRRHRLVCLKPQIRFGR